ncbi:hypothetical protein HK101_007945 [Irineochytrium annulatum]|nr:hypothetical protein HK101_007945 [Irineochytrium annulatum]
MAVPATSAAGANNNGAMTAAARDDQPDAYEAQAPGEIEGYGNPAQVEDGEMDFPGPAGAMDAQTSEREDDAQHAPDGAMEAQAPEDEEGDAQDAPEAEESAVTPGEEDAGVADVEPEAEVAGSHHHGHHRHHNRFHYRKSLRSRHRRRRFLRHRERSFLRSGKQVAYGSTYYRKATMPVVSGGGPLQAPVTTGKKEDCNDQKDQGKEKVMEMAPKVLTPAVDLSYKKSFYKGQQGTAGRKVKDDVRHFSDRWRRRRHIKVRHNNDG